MTAKTSENLAKVLESVGLNDMAVKARADKYHDFLSDDALCALTLEEELRAARDACPDKERAARIETVRQQHLNGEFDASMEESDEWASGPDGLQAFKMLLEGK
jgi:hypothetical protein